MSLFSFKRKPKHPETVEFDDVSVRRRLSDGRVESIRWDELVEVFIATSDEGPLVEDVYWLLIDLNNAGCAVAQSAKGADALLARLQALPGFDNEAVIAAMGSTANDRFTCWRKDDDA